MGDPSPPSGREDPVLIRVSDVRKTFRVGEEEVQALRGVSFEVRRGTILFIVGPSGSGKSTLLYLLGALDNPTSGTIVIDGEDLTAMDEVQEDIFRRGKIGPCSSNSTSSRISRPSTMSCCLTSRPVSRRNVARRPRDSCGRSGSVTGCVTGRPSSREASSNGRRSPGPDQGPGRPPRRRADRQPRPKRGRRDLLAPPRATEEPRLHAHHRHPRPSIHPALGSSRRDPGWAPRRLIHALCWVLLPTRSTRGLGQRPEGVRCQAGSTAAIIIQKRKPPAPPTEGGHRFGRALDPWIARRDDRRGVRCTALGRGERPAQGPPARPSSSSRPPCPWSSFATP